MMMDDLFAGLEPKQPQTELMADGAVLMRGRVLPQAKTLLGEIERIASEAPFRHMVTPGGFPCPWR